MNRIRDFLLFVVAFVLVTVARAQPEYAGNAFDKLQEATDDSTLYFGVVVVLAVAVAGFFLGRKWLKRVG